MCSIGVRYAWQLIIDDNVAPLAVKEEPQKVAAAASRSGVHEEARDQVVSLCNHSECAQEPTIAHSALQQVVGAESKVSNNDIVWQAPPHI
jgi:hypothetical protein